MISSANHNSRQDGFTLVEVLVALSILAISFAVLLPVFSGTVQRQSIISEQRAATLLASSKLSTVGVEIPLVDGVSSGAFANGFQWHLQISPYDAPQTSALMTAKLVTITVEWPSNRGNRSFEVKTIRLLGRE